LKVLADPFYEDSGSVAPGYERESIGTIVDSLTGYDSRPVKSPGGSVASKQRTPNSPNKQLRGSVELRAGDMISVIEKLPGCDKWTRIIGMDHHHTED